MLKSSIVLFSLIVFTSCGSLMRDGHVYFTIANDSGTQLFFDWCADYPDPDTAIVNTITPNMVKANPGCVIYPTSTEDISTHQLFGRIEKLYYNTEYKSFMLFDYDILMSPDISETSQAFIVRYDITLDDLNRLNWVLHYPPTPDMQDVHMYPPYGKVIEDYNRMRQQEE